MTNTNTEQPEALRELAAQASQNGEHIFTNPRDSNNWRANDDWHAAATPEVFLAMHAHIAELEAQIEPLRAALAAKPLPADGWLHENGLLYRLTDDRHPCNRDEINVTMADGSRSIESRSRRALELLDRIRSAAPQPAVAAGWVALPDEKICVDYALQYGGNCRDCADENGVCPSSGLPCAGARKAVTHVVKALRYGLQHGYLATPATIAGESK